jgi:acetyltransferase
MANHPLTALFEPHSIAVVGVSAEIDAIGTRVFQSIREGGFARELFAISGSDVTAPAFEHYASLAALPRRAELVVITEAAQHVTSLLGQCVEHGAKVALILSADFAERDLHAERRVCDAIANLRHSSLRVVGPHCLGVMRSSVQLNASLSRGIGSAGSLALISQSAGVCSAILDWARAHNVGFSTVASLGAAVDVGLGDVLDYLALDRETRAVLLYLEGADHARRFMSGLRGLARIKPVVVVKARRHAGHGDEPSRFSGLSSVEDAVFDAALRRAGAVRVATLPQLFSTAELLSHAPRLSGERLAVLTNTAGLGVLAADRAHDLGLPLATFATETHAQLTALLPSHTAGSNPLDLNADATASRYARILELCLADRGVDGALVLLSPQLFTDTDAVAAVIAEQEAVSRKPVLASFVGGSQVEAAREKLVASGVPTFNSPETAVEAFGQLSNYRRNRELLIQAPDVFRADALDIEGARLIIEAALSLGRTALSQLESKAVLSAFRIPVTVGVRTQDPNEALVAAQQIGFPVALKIDSLEIEDKSEVNGVRLNLQSAAEVRAAHRDLMTEVARLKPNARVLGVTVEPMRRRRQDRELVAAILHDTTFGPVVALGPARSRLGVGAASSFALPPLNRRLASDLIEQARKRGALTDYESWPAATSGALVQCLLRVSDLACELPEILELTMDPLLAEDDSVVALDARVTIRHVPASQRKYDQLAIAPYPRELVEQVQLADGTSIVVRPIRPEDAQLEQDFVRDLSLESRRYRFMHALSRLSDELLIRFTQLDYDRELGLIATQKLEAGEIPLGIARYIADSDELGCEFAVVVADAWQKRGVASQLMRALIGAARSRRLAYMHGDVLADNARMLRWMEKLGFNVEAHPEDAMVRVVTLPLR